MGRRIRDRDQPLRGWDHLRFYLLAVVVLSLTYLAMGAALWGDDLDGRLVGRSIGWGVVMGLVWTVIARYQQRAKDRADGDGVGRGW